MYRISVLRLLVHAIITQVHGEPLKDPNANVWSFMGMVMDKLSHKSHVSWSFTTQHVEVDNTTLGGIGGKHRQFRHQGGKKGEKGAKKRGLKSIEKMRRRLQNRRYTEEELNEKQEKGHKRATKRRARLPQIVSEESDEDMDEDDEESSEEVIDLTPGAKKSKGYSDRRRRSAMYGKIKVENDLGNPDLDPWLLYRSDPQSKVWPKELRGSTMEYIIPILFAVALFLTVLIGLQKSRNQSMVCTVNFCRHHLCT